MVKTAFLFPGQGAQHPGMCKTFCEVFPEARTMFEEAEEILGMDIADLCFNGPEEQLNLTENTQPAILIHSTIALKTFGDHGIDSLLAAGHSLGEFSALLAAGGLRFADAVHLVRKRGQFMQEAVPVGIGAMAAVLGLEFGEVQKLCDQHSTENYLVQPANMNSPGQIVVAGHKDAVKKLSDSARKVGAKKCVLLPVSAPFHCSLMKPAEIKLQEELEKIQFHNLNYPVITNADARKITLGSEARDALRRQVCSPVRWIETMELLCSEGVKRVIEFGPGRILSGLMKGFNKSVECLQVSDPDSLKKTLLTINSNGNAIKG